MGCGVYRPYLALSAAVPWRGGSLRYPLWAAEAEAEPPAAPAAARAVSLPDCSSLVPVLRAAHSVLAAASPYTHPSMVNLFMVVLI